jgi:hypothetical protein
MQYRGELEKSKNQGGEIPKLCVRVGAVFRVNMDWGRKAVLYAGYVYHSRH